MLADAVDPRAIGTDTMSAMHYRYQYNPDALAAPALLQSYSLLLQRWATSLPYLNPSTGGGGGMRSVWVWLHHALGTHMVLVQLGSISDSEFSAMLGVLPLFGEG